MTPKNYLEQDFEEYLGSSGYTSLDLTTYDKALCLMPSPLIELIQATQRIELLKEYRQSLISKVVIGKIDVRDWKN